jgi:predicted  nucleic acid-binding Zn-ribbon protein
LENHDTLTRLETNQEHIMKKLDSIEETLKDGRGRMGKHDVKLQEHESRIRTAEANQEKHADGHWKFTGLLITIVLAGISMAGFILKWVL